MAADLAVARGRIMHTFLLSRDANPESAVAEPAELELFERAAGLYRELGDQGGEAGAMFWVGCYHQVVRREPRSRSAGRMSARLASLVRR